jgi:uncharacterized membrane protein YgcG
VRDGNVLAIGDARFIAADRYNVADNNVFLAGVVEFLVSGDRVDLSDDAGDGGSGSDGENGSGGTGDGENGDAGGGGNETETEARIAG